LDINLLDQKIRQVRQLKQLGQMRKLILLEQ